MRGESGDPTAQLQEEEAAADAVILESHMGSALSATADEQLRTAMAAAVYEDLASAIVANLNKLQPPSTI